MAKVATTRSQQPRWRRLTGAICIWVCVFICAATYSIEAWSQAMMLTFPPNPPAAPKQPASGGSTTGPSVAPQKGPGDQMLVQAKELHYDYSNQRVEAIGDVQIYYARTTLEANRVIYDQKSKRLHAEGNVRLTEADGKVTYGEIMELSDDYRDGFVDSLRLDGAERTRFASATGERSGGNYEVFQNGVYTACEACKDDPKRPPRWQVKGARIIHDHAEKMIYFEDARIEFSGVPLVYMPYLSTPDPTVKRKSGFLMPLFGSSSVYGLAVETPYFWALAPDYDLTLSPRFTTTQGPLMQAEWRQRLEDGAYSVKTGGIYQLDRAEFAGLPGDLAFRGTVESTGQFNLSQKWVWGWNLVAPTDRAFYQDYGVFRFGPSLDLLQTQYTEGISQLYLAGRGDRSYFDARAIYFYGFSAADSQAQIPLIRPVVDYDYIFGHPVFGGELGFNTNLTSLSRVSASFDPISLNASNNGLCGAITANGLAPVITTADPALMTRQNCLLRGFAGDYTRVSADMHWRSSVTDQFGEVWTPFASIRADVAQLDVLNQPGVANYLPIGDSTPARVMPTAGIEYRYPFISVQSWGTQPVAPIAQVIARPNEQGIGKFPNEDAQSLVFDDNNLFRVDKFSGYDREEGGGRANVGVQYTAQFNQAGFVSGMFGQSYQLFGANSFAAADPTNTGLESGLDKTISDYVARISYQPDRTYTFTTRARFDEATFNVQRFEVEGRANYDRWTFTLLYGDYAAQPELGLLNRREGILGQARFKITGNWAVFGGANYDLEAGKFSMAQIGFGYVDDCLILALNYNQSYEYSSSPTTINNTVMLQLTLRTLGGTSIATSVGSSTVAP
jgi:LPS-assembly protein